MKDNTPFAPLNAPTLRVSHVRVLFDGGAHVLSLQEMRQIPPQAMGEAPRLGLYEVGRYTLSPLSLRWMIQHLQNAETAYEKAVGSAYPDEKTVSQRLGEQAAIEGLENDLRKNQPES